MGGGDLNLKKSWHPQTIRNVERVWKAEQKATAEAKKIEQLQRELMEERAREDMQRHAIEQGVSKKKSDRLEWMYATPVQVDREQYLLGKAIDKHVDPLADESKEESNVPGTSLGGSTNANNPADLAAKIRDDPLFLIKKKEEEKKKELLKNPVKMKHLRQMLQENLGKSKKKKERKRKKDKKEKRKKVRSSSDSSESEDEQEHHNGKRKHERENGIEHSRHDASSRHRDKHKKRLSSESPDRTAKHRRSKHSLSPPRTKHRKHSRRSRSRSTGRKKHVRSPSPSSQRHRSRSPQRNGHRDQWSREDRRERRSYSPVAKKSKRHSPSPSRRYRRESPVRRSRSRSRSPPRRDYQHSRGSAVTKKMSAEELEKRREEMLSNAQWRNTQRTANVKRFQETEKQEAETEAKNAGKSAKFLSDMKVESFSSDATSSVTDRIKRNINSLQRTNAALDTFLVKK